ncbi:MAG TPA: hypothetical protein VFK41_12035 [Nocardioidaceae bacterium]|nr:hypothetical protein [Nocardioidaceae bacterium]
MTRRRRSGLLRTVGLLVAVALVGAAPPAAVGGNAKVVRWVDGDTVVTTVGKIRLIGVDTPEVGECGHRKATRIARRLAPAGTVVRLGNPTSVDNVDVHGRLLRYVNVGTTDVGLRQIKRGSKARYDSLDGYDRHPRQDRYRRADKRYDDYCARTGDLKSYAPVSTYDCPSNAPIKGNDKSGDPDWDEPYKGIYHLPSQDYYDITTPEECFASEAGAVNAGYRKSQA